MTRPAAPQVWWTLGLLAFANFFNNLDRTVVAVLVEPMKHDLGLSDTQIGLVTGLAFALLYASAGLPLARLADRGSRVRLLAVCLAGWSLMAALTGTVRGFWDLFIVRMGVGVGEAGCTPTAFSMISAIFPAERRAFAFSLFQAGGIGGLTIGLAVSSLIAETWGWRWALGAVGLAGLPLALLIGFTVNEPPRSIADGAVPDEKARVAIGALMRRPAFFHVLIGLSIAAFAAYGSAQWFPAFYVRSHRLGLGEIGVYGSLASGGGGLLGTVLGGAAMIRLRARDPRWEYWLPMSGYLLAIPLLVTTLLVDDYRIAFMFQFFAVLAAASGGGAALAALQGHAEPHRRATAAALLLITSSLVGLGLGPLAVGIVSDLLAPRVGSDSLRIAMSLATLFYGWAALHFALAARVSLHHPTPAMIME